MYPPTLSPAWIPCRSDGSATRPIIYDGTVVLAQSATCFAMEKGSFSICSCSTLRLPRVNFSFLLGFNLLDCELDSGRPTSLIHVTMASLLEGVKEDARITT